MANLTTLPPPPPPPPLPYPPLPFLSQQLFLPNPPLGLKANTNEITLVHMSQAYKRLLRKQNI